MAADQSRPAERKVEIAEHTPQIEEAAPFLQVVELSGRIEAADNGADRSAGDHVGYNAMRDQGAQHADMGEAACRAAAQNKSDCDAWRPRGAAVTVTAWSPFDCRRRMLTG